MKLRDLLRGVDVRPSHGDLDAEISAVTADSRLVTSGALFVAVSGMHTDGAKFIDQAIGRGAAAEQQEASEDQRVAGDRPADARPAQVEISGDVGEGDVHGGDVEDDHQLGDEHDEQEDAAALAGGRLGATGSMLVAPTLGRRGCRSGGFPSVMHGRRSL